jgi:CheY-like chemotaxis protein
MQKLTSLVPSTQGSSARGSSGSESGMDGKRLALHGKPVRVLVVEDNGIIALDFSMKLEGFGAEVVGCAATAADAIQLALKLLPDVILMDIALRGKETGIDAVQAIRVKSQMPIIFVTGNGDPQTLGKVRDIGDYEVLLKPVNPTALRDAILEAVRGRQRH